MLNHLTPWMLIRRQGPRALRWIRASTGFRRSDVVPNGIMLKEEET